MLVTQCGGRFAFGPPGPAGPGRNWKATKEGRAMYQARISDRRLAIDCKALFQADTNISLK
jgi:hypothetical protein